MNPKWTVKYPVLKNSETSRGTENVNVNDNERTPLLLSGTIVPEHAQNGADVYPISTYIHIFFMAGLSMLLIIGMCTAGYLLITEETDWITWSTYSLVRRTDWQAETPEVKLIPYDNEITRIKIVSTNTTPCWDERECCDIIKKIQTYQMHDLKNPDIMYNFLIGNDGQIYEGTGWKRNFDISKRNHNNTIIIAFIGNLGSSIVDVQLETTKTFLDVFIYKKLIDKCFTILVPYDYKVSNYFLIDSAASLQKYASRYCSEKNIILVRNIYI